MLKKQLKPIDCRMVGLSRSDKRYDIVYSAKGSVVWSWSLADRAETLDAKSRWVCLAAGETVRDAVVGFSSLVRCHRRSKRSIYCRRWQLLVTNSNGIGFHDVTSTYQRLDNFFPAWLACMYAVFRDRSPIVEITFKRHANSSLTSLWRWLSENFVALFGIIISYSVLKKDPLAFLYLLKMYSNLYDFGGNLPGQSFNTTVFKLFSTCKLCEYTTLWNGATHIYSWTLQQLSCVSDRQ